MRFPTLSTLFSSFIVKFSKIVVFKKLIYTQIFVFIELAHESHVFMIIPVGLLHGWMILDVSSKATIFTQVFM